jgi:hypothetical protein
MPEGAPHAGPDDLLLHRLTDLLSGPAPDWRGAEELVKGIPPADAATRSEAESRLRTYEALRGRSSGPGATAAGWLARLRGGLPHWLDRAKAPTLWGLVVIAGLAVGALLLPGLDHGTAGAAPDPAFAPELIESLRQTQYPGQSYNLGQYTKLHVVPAPSNVIVDGDLSDWNPSGTFRSACGGTEASPFYVEGRMMDGGDQLFIGAHVGDLAPMRNQTEPADAGDPRAWQGGAVQVRLATRQPKEGETETSDAFVHLTLWYCQPRGQACLHLAFGMDLHGNETHVNGDGFQGAYRRDADGRGYTMEYVIPWGLLHADPPREDGIELGLCWNVLWSDADGREWRTKLVDVINPALLPNETSVATFGNRATWGQGVYHLPGK